jgi:hypothetical protein
LLFVTRWELDRRIDDGGRVPHPASDYMQAG